MALLWYEGFDNQTAAADVLQGVLSSITGSFVLGAGTTVNLAAGGQTQGLAIWLTSLTLGTAAFATRNVAQTVQGYQHWNIRLPAITAGDDVVLWWAFYDASAGAPQITVALDGATGVITTYSGWAPYTGNGATGGGTLLGTSAAGLVAPSVYTTVALGAKIDPSAGFVTVQVNGIPIAGASVVGVNTQPTANAYFNEVQIGVTVSAGTDAYTGQFDDAIVNDTTGSTFTTIQQPQIIYTEYATSNNSVQFTPLTGTNWKEISELQMDGDTSYNYSNTVGNTDLFASTNAPASTYSVSAVKLQMAARADNALGRQAANVLISGSHTFTGSASTKGTIYSYNEDYLPIDPNTSGTWTLASVLAVDFGYKVAG